MMDDLSELIVENRMLGMRMRDTLDVIASIRQQERRDYWKGLWALLTTEGEYSGWENIWLRVQTIVAMLINRQITDNETTGPLAYYHREPIVWFDYTQTYGGWCAKNVAFHKKQFAYSVETDGDSSM